MRTDRGWAPTILLCVAILLTAALVVVARPLTADAAGRGHSHAHVHALSRSQSKGAGARHAQQIHVTQGDGHSPNWSGYVASGQTFNQVSADWVQAPVRCPKKDAWTLFWVGFDGWPAGLSGPDLSVEQGGTSARCVNGVAHYSAFYEMWPTNAVTTLFAVQPSDHIAANVSYSSGQFFITVTDTTSGQSKTVTETCASNLLCARTSAEWIAESPSHFGTNNWFPLANYGTMNFTQASATNAGGVSGPIADAKWKDTGIWRVAPHTAAVAEVTPLENSGGTSAFGDTWTRRK
jgi:hypothetical protein